MKSFLETLNYSSSNEDSRSEVISLRIAGEDSVLCITGSGARTLDLLIENPREIVSIDFNPCQNFLLELKMHAIQHLDYEEFLEFLGVFPSGKRGHLYKAIRQALSTDARNFWDNNSAMIQNGVIYQGRWERYFHQLERLVSLARPHLRDKLFSCCSLSEQARIWQDEWNSSLWHFFLRSISSPVVWKYVFGDPGFYRYVPVSFSIYKYFNMRFTSASVNTFLKDSPFATLLFFGKYNPNCVLPAHLQERHYTTLRNNLERIRIVTQSLLRYLDSCKRNSFDKYSLSDFASYTNTEEYERIWKGIIKTATSGARVCERQFLVKREIPLEVRSCVTLDDALGFELTRTDNSIFYTFVIATVGGKND
jgi:S-adenosylmethionine-diacylglycerol 3-amino-3-carboxypropyl transferase